MGVAGVMGVGHRLTHQNPRFFHSDSWFPSPKSAHSGQRSDRQLMPKWLCIFDANIRF